jgi:hypothetical protein
VSNAWPRLIVASCLVSLAASCPACGQLFAQEPAAEQPPPVKVSGDLPWQKRNGAPSQMPSITPQAMLDLYGIDASHLQSFIDGRPLVVDEDETLVKLMFRMPRLEPPQWEAWCATEVPWNLLRDEPSKHRADCFILNGRATAVKRVEILKELVPRYEFDHYYRVTLMVDGQTSPVVVNARTIPDAWGDASTLDERVRVQAMFLKAGEPAESGTPLYFAAARIGWFPDRVNEALHVDSSLVWLAQQGFDVALFDDVRGRNVSAISASEGEAFYTLLALFQKLPAAALAKMPAQPLDLPLLLTTPEKAHGEVVETSGTARRVQKISVPEAFQKRLGIDHYYEIDFFIPLDNQAVRLAATKGNENAPTFTEGFPAAFCVVKLPPELEVGENIKTEIKVRGVFFKLWAYQSDYVQSFNENMKQPAPLMIGATAEVIAQQDPIEWGTLMPALALVAIVGGAMITWITVLRLSRNDIAFERKVLRKYTRPQENSGDEFLPPKT